MSVQNQIILLFFGACASVLLSNAGGVPQGVTQSPGEATHNSCATCHISVGNYIPAVALEVTDSNQSPVTTYIPGQTYSLKLKVSAQNNPKSFGFQMVSLDSLTITDRGNWLDLGEKVRVQNLTIKQKPRKYLVQSAPKADGTFVTKWKAPDTDIGPIKFYYVGLAVNLDGDTDGDNHATGNFSLHSPTSALDDDNNSDVFEIYPNPADEIIHVPTITSEAQITGMDGKSQIIPSKNGQINVCKLEQGAYVVRCFDQNGRTIICKSIIKQ
jgi:hypothetical protein